MNQNERFMRAVRGARQVCIGVRKETGKIWRELTFGKGPVLSRDARVKQAIVELSRGELGNERVHAVLRVQQDWCHACIGTE